MRTGKVIALLLSGAIAATSGIHCQAAAADRFSRAELKVLPARATLSEPSDGRRYRLGETLRLTRRNHLPKARADEVAGDRRFEVRIFRTVGRNDLPKPFYGTRDDCDVFLTLVYPMRPFRGDSLEVGPLASRNWLSWGRGTATSGYFLLVIEEVSRPDPKSSRKPNWQLFRLRHDMRSAYFAQGLHFEVAPRPGHGPAPAGPDEAAVAKSLEAVARQVAAQFYCYRPRIVARPAEGEALAFTACEVRGAPAEG